MTDRPMKALRELVALDDMWNEMTRRYPAHEWASVNASEHRNRSLAAWAEARKVVAEADEIRRATDPPSSSIGEAGPRGSEPFMLFNGEVIDLESKLPCKVTLHPGASFGKGVPISTMLVGLLHRQKYEAEKAADPERAGQTKETFAEVWKLPGMQNLASAPDEGRVCEFCDGKREIEQMAHGFTRMIPCPACEGSN